MNRANYYERHRQARLGNLGTVMLTTANRMAQWFLVEVYDRRFPHIGSDRHQFIWNVNFRRSLAVSKLHRALVEWHERRGWLNCAHEPLIRLWTEYKAIAFATLEAGEKPEKPLNIV